MEGYEGRTERRKVTATQDMKEETAKSKGRKQRQEVTEVTKGSDGNVRRKVKE